MPNDKEAVAAQQKKGIALRPDIFEKARAAGQAYLAKTQKDYGKKLEEAAKAGVPGASLTFESLPPPPVAPILDSGLESEDARPKELTLPKHAWMPYALRQHPELVELRERTKCFLKNDQISHQGLAGRTEVKESLSRQALLQSIMQFLDTSGCPRARRALEDESHDRYMPLSVPDKSLQALLRLGITDPKTIFELDNRAQDTQGDNEVELVDHGPSRIWQEGKENEKNDFGNIKIWDETEMSQNLSLSKTGEVLAGTINKLIEHMTSENCHDSTFLNTFLVTYQSFITPEQLMSILIDRYNVPRERFPRLKADEFRRSIEFPIQQRVFTVLKTWLTDHFSDFTDKLLEQLNHFASTVLVAKGQRHWARQLRNIISQMQTADETPKYDLEKAPDPKVPKNIFSPSLDLFDVDEEEIARQLCIVDWNAYQQIQSVEFLNKAWTKPRNPKNQNILVVIKRSEDFATWVAYHIVSQEKLKSRSKTLQKFINLAHHLRLMNNISSCLAVLEGLRKPAVKKLRWSKEELPKKSGDLWAELEKAFPAKMDYRSVKDYMKKCVAPAVPPIEPFIRELTTIEDTYSDMVNNRLINFRMLKSVLQIIHDFRTFRTAGYDLLPVFQIQQFVSVLDENATKHSDDDLVKLAQSREG